MNKPKTIYLIFFLVFLIIVLLIILLFKKNGPKTQVQSQIPVQSEIPVSTQTVPTYKFSIISTNITLNPIGVADAVEILFSEPVNNESLNLTLSPEESILPLFNDNLTTLTIKPTSTWLYDTSYIIRVSSQTKSAKDQNLDKNYEFTFKTIPFSGI